MMQWNVFIYNFNARSIETLNIFNHTRFRDECIQNAKKNHGDRDAFEIELRKSLMYYFWSKCEYEIFLSGWDEKGKHLKVDIFQQVDNNWEVFAEYCWQNLVVNARSQVK